MNEGASPFSLPFYGKGEGRFSLFPLVGLVFKKNYSGYNRGIQMGPKYYLTSSKLCNWAM
jgi:hypothetical protein